MNQEIYEVLKWYQSRVADCRKISPDGDKARRELDADGGSRATQVLTDHGDSRHD